MKRYLSIYMCFLKQYFKNLIEYKQDFIFGIVGFFMIQITSLLFIGLIFQNIPTLDGWNFYEILFIYGFSQIPRGIDHIFTDYLWIFSGFEVKKGMVDRYLLRPLNPLFQVIANRFQPEGFGEIIMGSILVIYSGMKLSINIRPLIIIGFILSVIGGTFIYFGIKLLTSSLSFWFKDSFRHLQITYELSSFAKYPVSIYPNSIKSLLTFVIPFAFTGFFPSAYILGKTTFTIGVLGTLLIGFIVFTFAYATWLKGLSIYESSGN